MNAKPRLSCSWVSKHCESDALLVSETLRPELLLPLKPSPEAPRSNGQGCRVIGTAKAKTDVFGITVNQRAIGVVPVDLERGVPAAVAGHRESANRLEEYCGR